MSLTISSRATYLALFLTSVLSAFVSIRAAEPTGNARIAPDCWTDRTLTLEQRKLCLEAAKLKQEKQKARRDFRLEIWKAVITALSVGVPLGGAVIAILGTEEGTASKRNLTVQAQSG
jgi:hypothetical protein